MRSAKGQNQLATHDSEGTPCDGPSQEPPREGSQEKEPIFIYTGAKELQENLIYNIGCTPASEKGSRACPQLLAQNKYS